MYTTIMFNLPQVYDQLSKLDMCVSHATTLRMLDQLGKNYDSAVYEWRDALKSKISDEVLYSLMLLITIILNRST